MKKDQIRLTMPIKSRVNPGVEVNDFLLIHISRFG